MKLVYLADGQSAYLKEQIGDRFVVNKIYSHEEEFGTIETWGNDIIVDSIYTSKPIALFDSEIQALKDKKAALIKDVKNINQEKSKAEYLLNSARQSIIAQDKFIINKSELLKAKSIAYFPDGRIMPVTMKNSRQDRDFYGLRISIELKIDQNEERSWGAKLYNDRADYNSQFLCKKEGIIINPTKEQLDEIIRRRASEVKVGDWELKTVPDHYLSELTLERKRLIIETEAKEEVLKLQNTILEAQAKINKLQAKGE